MIDDLQIEELYRSGISCYKISKEYEVKRWYVEKLLRSKGYDIGSKKWKREDPLINHKDVIINRYLAGEGSFVIAKDYGVRDHTILKLLKKCGIETRDQRRINFNQDYFKVIDTQDKAYTLGMFYADGNVNENNARLSITDRDVVEKIAHFTEFDGEIKVIKPRKINHKPQYKISFNCRSLCKDLVALGCVPNKSKILRFPSDDQVPPYLIRHFLRGVFDGDGGFCINKQKDSSIPNHVVGICCTEDFHTVAKKVIYDNLGIKCGIQTPNRKSPIVKRLTIGGNLQVIRFMDWLYLDSIIHMDRKLLYYKELLRCYN